MAGTLIPGDPGNERNDLYRLVLRSTRVFARARIRKSLTQLVLLCILKITETMFPGDAGAGGHLHNHWEPIEEK